MSQLSFNFTAAKRKRFTPNQTKNQERRKQMKYQVMLNNTQVLSTHKNRELAEKALRRWMKKHEVENQAHNDLVGWVDPKLCRKGGMYHVRAI